MGRLLLALVMLQCCVSPVHARSLPPLEGLEVLRKAFAGVMDFTADITQEKRLSVMKRTLVMTGTVRFKKPDMFFMSLNPPYANRLVVKDSVMEQAGGPDSTRNKILLPPEQGLGRWFAKLATPLTSLPEGMVIQADLSNSLYTIIIVPQGKGQVKEVTISLLVDGTIRRLAILEKNGDKATMTFKNMRRNIGLADRDFSLE